MTEDTYRKSWNRQQRGLLIFLLDQSGSMDQAIQVGTRTYTNGQMATSALNSLIFSVIKNTPPDPQRGGLKDYCDVLVLGYGDQVKPLLDDGHGKPISIRELAAHPKGKRLVLVERYDSRQGKMVAVKETQLYWIDCVADSRLTEMAQALDQAHQALQGWLPQHYQSFPPIVINITDGIHNGQGNPIEASTRIRTLYTNDGHVLLFSCHLTSSGEQGLIFPRVAQQIDASISNQDERGWARQLFTMSSILPASMIQKARTSFNVGLEDGAHGFIYNATPGDLIDFLRWGTQPGDNLRG